MRKKLSPKNQARGYQLAANVVSIGRGLAAPFAAKRILENEKYQSVGFALISTAIDAGDKVDGKLAKKAKAICGEYGLSYKGQPRLDDGVDKIWNLLTLGPIGVREIRNRNYAYGIGMLSCVGICLVRDVVVTHRRSAAEAFNAKLAAEIPKNDLADCDRVKPDALFSGQVKQTGFCVDRTIGLSPITVSETGEMNVGQKVTLGIMVGSTALALTSGREQIRSLREQQAVLEAKYFAPTP